MKFIVTFKHILLISIPYGAIKSNRLWQVFIVNLSISIPYGAIKRDFIRPPASDQITFQFLMVRLKVLLLYYFSIFFYISIPYGAIKSAGVFLSQTRINIFQFLMVRLKDKSFNAKQIIFIYFNSLWCD